MLAVGFAKFRLSPGRYPFSTDRDGYKIHVYGAATSGLTPQAWMAIKKFWAMYFRAAGAELVSYSAECEIER